MATEIVAAAKRLGWLAQPDFCRMCFQLKHAVNWSPPWNVFPGAFTYLDLAQKAYVTGYLDNHGCLPPCMAPLGDAIGYVPSPKMHDFFFLCEKHQVRVRGEADLILKLRNRQLGVRDLKTAKAKGTSDPLFPTYAVQLNCYARAAQERGLGEVADVMIVYMAPAYDLDTMTRPENDRDNGIAIPFATSVCPVALDLEHLDDLCGRYRELCEAEDLLPPYPGCKECSKFQLLVKYYNERNVQAVLHGYASGDMYRKLFAHIRVPTSDITVA